MQQIDQELLVWAFIGAAGLGFGIWSLMHWLSGHRAEADLSRWVPSGKSTPRRERISARPASVRLPEAEPESAAPRQPEAGPGRPSLFVIDLGGKRLMLQRAGAAECREGLSLLAAGMDERRLKAAAQALAERGAALALDPDAGLDAGAFSLCLSDAEPAEAGVLPACQAYDREGLAMGTAGAWPNAEETEAALCRAFEALHEPAAVLAQELIGSLEKAGAVLAELGRTAPERAAEWHETAAALRERDAAPDALSAEKAEECFALVCGRIEALDQEFAQLGNGMKTLEHADEALIRAKAILLEREAAGLLQRSFAAAIASADFRRGIHSVSAMERAAASLPSAKPLAEAARGLALHEAEASARAMPPQRLDLLARVRRDADALEDVRRSAEEALTEGAAAFERAIDERLLGERAVARLIVCSTPQGAAFARPR